MKLPLPIQNFVGLLRYAIIFQAVYFLTIPIVLAKYSSAQYGVFTIAFAIASIIGSISALRLERALVVEAADYIKSLLSLCSVSALCLSTVVFIVTYYSLHSINTEGNSALMLGLLAALYSMTIGAVQVMSHLAIKQERVMLTGISDVIYAVLLALGLYWIDSEHLSPAVQLFTIFLAARVISLAPYWRLSYKFYFNLPNLKSLGFPQLKKYFVPVATTFLANIQFRGLFYITGVFYSSSVTGNLAMTHRIMQAPVNLLGASLRKAFFLEFTAASEKDTNLHNHIATIWRLGTITTIVVFPIFFILVTKSDILIPKEWQLLPYFALAMYPAISLIVLLSWLDRLYDAFHKQTRAFYLELAYTFVLYVCIFGAVLSGFSSIQMMLVYSVVTTIYNTYWAFLSLKLINMQTAKMRFAVITHFIMLVIVLAYLLSESHLT